MICRKRIEEITADDLAKSPVWQFVNTDEAASELLVRPVTRIPVKNMTGRIVGTKAKLANGEQVWVLLGNIDLGNARLTRHFLTLSALRGDAWFSMARYHDFDWRQRGPRELADFLGRRLDQVYPISYDLSDCCLGDCSVVSGNIVGEPEERLSRAEIIALAVP